MPSFKALVCLIAIITSSQAIAGFEDISKLFNQGEYSKVLLALESFKPKKKIIRAEKFYFMGISQSRLEQYDPAAKSLIKAIKLGSKRSDIYYEVGQAHYGNNDLPTAQKYFALSAKNGFKPSLRGNRLYKSRVFNISTSICEVILPLS